MLSFCALFSFVGAHRYEDGDDSGSDVYHVVFGPEDFWDDPFC